MLGSDGGVNVSYDGGRTADYFPNMRIGEVYAVGVDMDDPYNVYAGLQDHDSWKGPSNGKTGTHHAGRLDDGRHRRRHVQPGGSDRLTVGLQHVPDWAASGASISRPVRPPSSSRGAPGSAGASLQLGHADRALAAQSADRLHRRAGAVSFAQSRRRLAGDQPRSDDQRRDDVRPELRVRAVLHDHVDLGIARDARASIWIGTDDGKVHVTRDHGGTWTDADAAVASAGGPADRYVSRVFASPHDAGTAFVAKSGFRNDDFRPFLYRTTDFGKTWTSISRQPARLADQRRRAGSEERATS